MCLGILLLLVNLTVHPSLGQEYFLPFLLSPWSLGAGIFGVGIPCSLVGKLLMTVLAFVLAKLGHILMLIGMSIVSSLRVGNPIDPSFLTEMALKGYWGLPLSCSNMMNLLKVFLQCSTVREFPFTFSTRVPLNISVLSSIMISQPLGLGILFVIFTDGTLHHSGLDHCFRWWLGLLLS